MELIDSYCVLISSKVVYFLKPGDYVDREAIFLEVKYDDLYHCLISKDHGKVYLQLTKKAESSGSGVAIPGPSHKKPMVRRSSSARNECLLLLVSRFSVFLSSLKTNQKIHIILYFIKLTLIQINSNEL